MSSMAQPRLLVIEAARIFDAEASALVGVFASKNYKWKVLSNDPMWGDSSWPTREKISATIEAFDPTIIHFALHGRKAGLCLTVPEVAGVDDVLSWSDIESMPCWKKRVVITGACGILPYSDAFLKAGATAVVAPSESIMWDRLCHFVRIFYSNLLDSQSLEKALAYTVQNGNGYYEQYEVFGINGEKDWSISKRKAIRQSKNMFIGKKGKRG